MLETLLILQITPQYKEAQLIIATAIGYMYVLTKQLNMGTELLCMSAASYS